MPECSELHPGTRVDIPPQDMLAEVFDWEPRPILETVRAAHKGFAKYGGTMIFKSLEDEVGHIRSHLRKLDKKEMYDQKDGQHHAASVALRALKIIRFCTDG